jgi:hypothetical protein
MIAGLSGRNNMDGWSSILETRTGIESFDLIWRVCTKKSGCWETVSTAILYHLPLFFFLFPQEL